MPDGTLTCPILIGRDACVAEFSAAFESAVGGRGLTVTVAGEAGVGKSRLVRTLLDRAAELSPETRVLAGNCFEGDADVPFAPLVDLWRSFALNEGADALAGLFAHEGADVARLLPELSEHLPGGESAPAADPEQEKRRLFQSLLQPLLRLSKESPLVVVIEDVHLSDDTTIDFLLQVARRARELPLVMLLTYRTEDAGTRLRHFLAELDRGRLGREIVLRRLSRGEVAEMIGAVLGGASTPREDFVALVHDLTDGNPFFIEEVLKSLATAGGPGGAGAAIERAPLGELEIPRSVQDAVQRRSAQLSRDAQRLLELAAVAGRRFDLTLLSRPSETDEARLLDLVKELVAAQLVVEESADRFAFRHALTQQAVYAGLLMRERRALHLEIAAAIEATEGGVGESRAGDLAHHYYEAEAWDRAFEYASKAGEMAQRLFSPAAVARQLTRALDSAKRAGIQPARWIYSARGRANDALGNFDDARVDHEVALELARGAGDRPGEWQALLDLGFLWATRDYDRAGDFFRRALDLARAEGDPAVLGRSLNRFANWQINTGRAREGLEGHRAALQLFTANADRQGVAETLDLLGMAYGMYGDLVRCVEHYGQAIELLRELGDEQRLMSALSSITTYGSPGMADTVTGAGRTEEDARRDGSAAMQLAERSGFAVGLAYAHWTLAAALGSFGRMGEGLRIAEAGLRIATEIQHEQWMIGGYFTLGQLHWLALDGAAAIRELEQAVVLARPVKSAWWIGNVSSMLALAYLMNGDRTSARGVLEATGFEADAMQTLPERRVAWARAELLLAEGARGEALRLVDRLLASMVDPETAFPPPPLLLTKGLALAAGGDDAAACGVLEWAEESAASQGDLPWLWRARCALSHAYLSAGRRDEAERKRDEARELAERLSSDLEERARSRFLEAAEQRLPRLRPPTARRAAKQEWQGLTEREREIAAYVTRGRANREIAEALVLSERTVETHIGNILSKLGFSSRAQVAAWGAERGLLSD